MTINQAMTTARQMMKSYNELSSWRVTYNNRKRAFGVCNYKHSQIELSRHLVPVMTDEAIIDTIIHEIAHALTPGNNHDYVWQSKCVELGGNGQRTGGSHLYKDGVDGQREFQEKTAKYTLSCPCCDNVSYLNRRPRGSVSCGKHNSRGYNEKYKMTIVQNH